MAWKLEPGLRVAIKVLLKVRSRYEHGTEGWETCDEILRGVHAETDWKSQKISVELDELLH